MGNLQAAIGEQTRRQVEHWLQAASRLDLDDLAAPEAWGSLEQYLGVSLRAHLQDTIDRLVRDARGLTTLNEEAQTPAALELVHRRLPAFRHQYLRAETTVNFFVDAINSRTSPQMRGILGACDALAHRSMSQLLNQIGKTAPVPLTYVDNGLGASILKAGLRLWDGGQACPVAAIKITRHNLLRPTALIHEAGHQVAHITQWNHELAVALDNELRTAGANKVLAGIWASWASEIAADAFAFAHAGFASIAALHDVLAGDLQTVLRYSPGDPHPIGYLRVLLGVQMCRHFYGDGPWDALAESWVSSHSLQNASSEARAVLVDSQPLLGRIVYLLFDTPMQAFLGRSLRALIPPERVSPAALTELGSSILPALVVTPELPLRRTVNLTIEA